MGESFFAMPSPLMRELELVDQVVDPLKDSFHASRKERS
jgi:hypothetical protein